MLIGTPDHWHALPMIEAVKSRRGCVLPEADAAWMWWRARRCSPRRANTAAWCRSARSAAARRISSRRASRSSRRASSARSGYVEICCYYHMRAKDNPPDIAPPEKLDYEMWTGPAPMRPYNALIHPRKWRAFMEYGNGIVGDMCVHMLDMTRWMLDLGWPTRISSSGGIFVDKASKANITDTQSATFEFDDLRVVWTHRSWGDAPDPKYPVGRDLLRRQRDAEGEREGLRLHAARERRRRVHKDVAHGAGGVSRGQDGEGSGEARRARRARPHEGFPRGDRQALKAGRRHRAGPHLQRLVHPRESLA